MQGLTPKGKQEEVLALPATGHIVVLGTAGSGKTTIAVLRAEHLANMPTAGKVLLVTFNGALAEYMRKISSTISCNLVVENYHKFAKGYLNSSASRIPPSRMEQRLHGNQPRRLSRQYLLNVPRRLRNRRRSVPRTGSRYTSRRKLPHRQTQVKRAARSRSAVPRLRLRNPSRRLRKRTQSRRRYRREYGRRSATCSILTITE